MSNSNKTTVDEFVIAMSLQETVLKGLNKLDKQILPIANRMEKTLNKSFSKDYSKGMNKTFTNIERRAQQASRNINKSLSQAFAVGNANSGLFDRYRREGNAAAREVGRAIRGSYRIREQANPTLLPLPRTSRPRSESRQVIEAAHNRQLTSALYGNLQLRDSNRAAEYRARLERLRMEHTASQDVRGFRNNLRTLNHEFAQSQRAASMQRASTRLQALESSNAGAGLSRLADGATGLLAGFFALNRAMSFLQDSITVGGKFQQAHTMGLIAYGSETENTRMTGKADETSRAYGLDPLQTREQMAQMRMTMPDNFSNDKISELFENESVYAHTTGMDPQAVGRLNYALQQISVSAHLMGQDFLQIVNASPALVKGLQQLHGLQNSSQLKEYYKTVPGSAFVEDALKVMKPTDQQKTLAQNNIIAAQGRLAGSMQFAKRDFFDQMEKPIVRLFATLTDSADNLGVALTPAAKGVGFLADRISDLAEGSNKAAMNISGYAGLATEHWTDFYNGLDKSTQSNLSKLSGVFNQWFDVLIAVVAGKLALAGISKVGQMAGLGGIGGVMGAAGRTFAIAAAVVLGKELGDLVFDQWVPAFHKAMGWDDTKTNRGGNVVEGSWVDTGLNWFGGIVDMVKQSPLPSVSGYPALSSAIVNPSAYMSQKQALTINQEPIRIAPFEINVPLPDGSTYTQMIKPVVMDAVQQQHEFQMMSAQGLQGSWQGAGDNAGFSPSSLLRGN